MILNKAKSYILLIILWINIFIGDFSAYALSPSDISNKVFFLDWQDTDNDWIIWNEPANNSNLIKITDKFNFNTWSQLDINKQPVYKTNSINTYPSISFNWTSSLLNINDNINITSWTWYNQKSYSLIIKTSNDINTFQTIYDEWTKQKWFSIQLENWHLYAWAYNILDWPVWEEYKIIDLGLININTIYTIFLIFDSNNDFIKWYLNWNLISTINNISPQTNHWACPLDWTWLDCVLYLTWWSISIWSTKNDILKLSNNTEISIFEWNYFKWNIWEISSYNYALTDSEVNWINDYLFIKWWIDLIAPIITWTNFNSWILLPWWNHNIIFNYNDSHTWSLWIDINSANIILEKWDWISYNLINWFWTWTITETLATYPTNNLSFWKYKASFNISDNYWNISNTKELVFYIDNPQMIISTGSIDIWNVNDQTNTFAQDITITVKTVWTWFNVQLKKNQTLNSSTTFIPYYDWTIWVGYDKNKDWRLFDYNDDIIWQEIENINTDWNLNTYTYTVSMWAIIEYQQAWWDYSWKIDFWINLDY
jgi:hypothetical protein